MFFERNRELLRKDRSCSAGKQTPKIIFFHPSDVLGAGFGWIGKRIFTRMLDFLGNNFLNSRNFFGSWRRTLAIKSTNAGIYNWLSNFQICFRILHTLADSTFDARVFYVVPSLRISSLRPALPICPLRLSRRR